MREAGTGPGAGRALGAAGAPDVAELAALDAAGLNHWARSHVGAATVLAARSVARMGRERGPHGRALRRFASSISGLRADARRADVLAVRQAFDALPAAARELVTVAYPGVVGPLNGVPFEYRVRANQLVVVAALHTLQRRERIEARRQRAEGRNRVTRWAGRLRAWAEPSSVRARRRDLGRMVAGFRHAVEHQEPPLRLLVASTAGAGRVVALDGVIGEGTRSVTVFVPGTTTDANSLQANMERLRAVDGSDADPVAHTGVYWEGAEFPRTLVDNAAPRFAIGLRDLLAAFDAALDLETAVSGARQIYVGHSFGGAAIGSAEALGHDLTADAVVYAGAPGAGYGIRGPQDTANPFARRYALVAQGDLNPAAGHFFFGRTMGAAPLTAMGVTRLSTGFLDHAGRTGRLHNHDDYFRPGSTSALNIRAVALAHPVLEWQGSGLTDAELAAHIDAAGVPALPGVPA